jgi:tetraacyldisaccharide 4'-kinase
MEQRNALYYIFSVVRLLLYPIALLYGAIVWWRNRMYDTGLSSSVRFSVPVIAIGNLSTGGTGKTPHVEYLVRLLQYRYQVATMSRGYKRRTQGFILAGEDSNALRIGDEPMQYHLKFPELAVSVAEERMTGIPALLQRRPDVDVILLDDAYQHRSVKAGLNILITDHSRPFYKDHILPFGSLREGRGASKRANVIIVSKCPLNITATEAQTIKANIAPHNNQQVFFTGLQYMTPYNFITGEPVSLEGKNALLVCGIARPEPLLAFISQQAAGVHTLSYSDHHYFVSADLEEIKSAYGKWDVAEKVIVTTEKDAARLMLHYDKLAEWGITIAVLPVAVVVLLGGGEELDAIVLSYVEKTIADNMEDQFAEQPVLF